MTIEGYRLTITGAVRKSNGTTRDLIFNSDPMFGRRPCLLPSFTFDQNFDESIPGKSQSSISLNNEIGLCGRQLKAIDILDLYRISECVATVALVSLDEGKSSETVTTLYTGTIANVNSNANVVTINVESSAPKYAKLSANFNPNLYFNSSQKGQTIGTAISPDWAVRPFLDSNINDPASSGDFTAFYYLRNFANVCNVPLNVIGKANNVNGVSRYINIGLCYEQGSSPLAPFGGFGIQGNYDGITVIGTFNATFQDINRLDSEFVWPITSANSTAMMLSGRAIPFFETEMYFNSAGTTPARGTVRMNLYATQKGVLFNTAQQPTKIATTNSFNLATYGANLPAGTFSINFVWDKIIILDSDFYDYFFGLEGVPDSAAAMPQLANLRVNLAALSAVTTTYRRTAATTGGAGYSNASYQVAATSTPCYSCTCLGFERTPFFQPGALNAATGLRTTWLQWKSFKLLTSTYVMTVLNNAKLLDSLDCYVQGRTVQADSSIGPGSPSNALHTMLTATQELTKRWNGSAWVAQLGTPVDRNSTHAGAIGRKARSPYMLFDSGTTADEALKTLNRETGLFLYANRSNALQSWAYGTFTTRIKYGPSDFKLVSYAVAPARNALRKLRLKIPSQPYAIGTAVVVLNGKYYPDTKEYSATGGFEPVQKIFQSADNFGDIQPFNRDEELRATSDIDFVAYYYAMTASNPRIDVTVEIHRASASALQLCDVITLTSPEIPSDTISGETMPPIWHNNVEVENQNCPIPAASGVIDLFIERIVTKVSDGIITYVVSGRQITNKAEWI